MFEEVPESSARKLVLADMIAELVRQDLSKQFFSQKMLTFKKENDFERKQQCNLLKKTYTPSNKVSVYLSDIT